MFHEINNYNELLHKNRKQIESDMVSYLMYLRTDLKNHIQLSGIVLQVLLIFTGLALMKT